MDKRDLIDGLINDAMSVLHHDGVEGDEVDKYERETLARKFAARLGGIAFTPRISDNQVLPAEHILKREDSVLETVDGADDRFEDVGPAVKVSPYKAPKDPRVQTLLRAAAADRAAQADLPTERKVFTDPRLEPNYRAPKLKK